MVAEYASQKPQGYSNYIKNVAIVGATGQVGSHILEHLLKNGKHQVTAITREDSPAAIPDGVKVAKVDYSDPRTLVEALRGQEALIITISVTAPRDTQSKLIEAAAAAGVPWVIPNEWGSDPDDKKTGEDIFLGPVRNAARKHIEDLGKSSFIGTCCGFWYEFSLAGSVTRYGFDFPSRKVIFYDDGDTKINTSTWPQCGRAIANLLALKVLPDGEEDKSPTLSRFRNETVYISSFLISQKDMFDSVLRVTGDTADDWAITYQPSVERYKEGIEIFQGGDRAGFGQALYARLFYQDGSGNHAARKALHNDILGLPKEDLDEFTAVAVEMAKAGFLSN
ncbi:Bifunctional pinoresinol-lariciresinol reductase [Cytospora mali]|uniref:Bifunctional pinoresinol-lariciresinol reductase n=1 Tax=Cytospora mali TaxID=578113 RepID=A0A194VYB4_CYTMA|nr:Bifunctional pinoresinol-lariciresinol reductase [Valsa mali]